MNQFQTLTTTTTTTVCRFSALRVRQTFCSLGIVLPNCLRKNRHAVKCKTFSHNAQSRKDSFKRWMLLLLLLLHFRTTLSPKMVILRSLLVLSFLFSVLFFVIVRFCAFNFFAPSFYFLFCLSFQFVPLRFLSCLHFHLYFK